MIDIDFYRRAHNIIQQLHSGKNLDPGYVFKKFEEYRCEDPVVYNIETTNACNMKCQMCPRTTMMTRRIETIDVDTFTRNVMQLKPHTDESWEKWKKFVISNYNIHEDEMSENHFFLYIIPKVIQLHGYGDPLLDKNMDKYVKILTKKGISSYFSCNPANINIDRTIKTFENGLDYIKYSIESVDDFQHKMIRGNASNFLSSYKKILKLLELKEKENYKTTIIITMLDLNNTGQIKEYKKLKEAFKGLDVYIYLKSEDQLWYRKDYHPTKSIHWSELCKHPWMSMTIKSNGEAAMCMEDYNNEIILGDTKEETLFDIWNGKKYKEFRKNHFDSTPGIKCTEQCDMTLVGDLLNSN
jgi:MoaA/NifB/PqqE/SkfB family radical SAM enzyme